MNTEIEPAKRIAATPAVGLHGVVKSRRGWRKALMKMGGVSCLMVAHDESATAHGWQWLTVALWVFWSLMILKNENET